ncbi:hypothetical protein Tco_0135050 [Tanacetum coccineum]
MVEDLKSFKSLENEVKSLQSQLELQQTKFSNEIDRLSREYYYANHMNAILGVYNNLDEYSEMACDYLKADALEFTEFFEINELKAQLQDKKIAISTVRFGNDQFTPILGYGDMV